MLQFQSVQEVDAAIAKILQVIQKNNLEAGDGGSYHLHMADNADCQVAMTSNEMILNHLNKKLHRLQRIREMVVTGTYGRCIDCGNQIPPLRLEVKPDATRCVLCQGRHEVRNRS